MKINCDTSQNPAWQCVLGKHGWEQSQATGTWFRTHDNRKTEFVSGPHIPHYAREVRKLRRASNQLLSLFS